MPSLIVSSLFINLTPGLLNASASGSISGATVAVQLTSIAQPDSPGQRVGSIRVTSSSGASLDALLAGQAAAVSTDVGIAVPALASGGSSTGEESSAELVFDSLHGLRMLNISLASSAKLGIAGLAARVGFAWQAGVDGSSDPVSFTAPWLYYVPSKPGAPSLTWLGRTLGAAELGVAATVDVPALGISSMRGELLVMNGGFLRLRVGAD